MKTFMQDEHSKNGNKRHTPRWNLQGHCVYQSYKGPIDSKSQFKDVSCTGVCVETDQNFPINQNVNLTLHLPDSGVINVCGTAVWAKAVNSHFEVGIHFFNLSGETQDTILLHAANVNQELLTEHWFQGWKSS